MNIIERTADKWLARFHWTHLRAPHQYQWYRCMACKSLVSWKHITRDGGCKCGSARIGPTIPLGMEKVKVLFLPWMV